MPFRVHVVELHCASACIAMPGWQVWLEGMTESDQFVVCRASAVNQLILVARQQQKHASNKFRFALALVFCFPLNDHLI